MKKIFFAFAVLATSFVSAQVGVGNTEPKATLDVNKASYTAGEQAGIAVTQQTAAQIVAMTTTDLKPGTLVYATSTSGTITSTGFWYYDGTAWTKVSGVSAPSYSSVTLSKDATYTALNASEVTPNNVTTIIFIGTSPSTLTISNLPAGAANIGKILNIYNASATNIGASFNRAGDGAAASLTINGSRGFSFVWDGTGWARTSY
jgi:hypothetical protein